MQGMAKVLSNGDIDTNYVLRNMQGGTYRIVYDYFIK